VTKEEYLARVRSVRPRANLGRNVLLSFLMGGAIALAGQLVHMGFARLGLAGEAADAPTAVVLVGLAALLTALGVYDRLVEWGGMGAVLPITGFANAMVAPAMEFRREGLVLGMGARMFQVAGPVLAFGLMTAFLVGLGHLALGALHR